MDASALTLSGQGMLNSAMLRARAQQAEQAQQATVARLGSAKMNDINKAAQDFEAMFVSEMLGHMFSGVEVDPEFGGGHGEEMFRSMLVQEYGKEIAKGPGIGIASKVKEAMIAMQSVPASDE